MRFRDLIERVVDRRPRVGYTRAGLLTDDAPTNNAGGGQIAGLGVGPQGEPPAGKRRRKRVKAVRSR